MAHKILVVVVFLWLCCLNVAGQEPADSITLFKLDTLGMNFGHSPAKAAIMSAVVPGLGQIYNRKYWKLPVVYAAIGISVERFITFQNEYNKFRRAYIDLKDNDPYTNYHLTFGIPPSYPVDQIITQRKEKLRTWRDWTIVAMVAAYALNIIDANVDAHLMDFSLDDNISIKIQPCFFENSANFQKIGLTLRFTF